MSKVSRSSLIRRIKSLIEKSIVPGYIYTYPHKKAFRRHNLDMASLWTHSAQEVNLYVHIPFCQRRCSYCNLFTLPLRGEGARDYVDAYVDAVLRQIKYYAQMLGQKKVMSVYFGGGTPNFLSISQLSRIATSLRDEFPDWVQDIEPAIECSPALLDADYIVGLHHLGFRRISMGVQSFKTEVLEGMNRDSDVLGIEKVYALLKQAGLNVNLDVIYGLDGQDRDSILYDISAALNLRPQPDNLSLYPLVVRELTRLHQLRKEGDKAQFDGDVYQLVGEMLARNGYVRRSSVRAELISSNSSYSQQILEFQGYPTVGIGAGARSYTERCHYSMAYGINPKLTRQIINQFVGMDFHEHSEFEAFMFDDDELRRKFVIYGLLGHELNADSYRQKFQEPIEEYFGTEIEVLLALNLIARKGDVYVFTDYGKRYSDIVVQVFYSEKVRQLEESYQLA